MTDLSETRGDRLQAFTKWWLELMRSFLVAVLMLFFAKQSHQWYLHVLAYFTMGIFILYTTSFISLPKWFLRLVPKSKLFVVLYVLLGFVLGVLLGGAISTGTEELVSIQMRNVPMTKVALPPIPSFE